MPGLGSRVAPTRWLASIPVARTPNQKKRGPVKGIPELKPDLTVIAAYLEAWARAHAKGSATAVDVRVAAEAAGKMTQVVRTQNGLDEMNELRDLVARAERATAERKALEVAARYGQGSEHGKWAVDDDGN